MADTDALGGNEYSTGWIAGKNDLAELEVRIAEPEDIDRIAEIAHDYEGEKWTWNHEAVSESLDYFFVVGRPVLGFVRAEPADDKLVLTFIAVDRTARKKGIATLLLRAMEAIAESTGLEGVVNFGPKTQEITNLYHKLGYVEINRVKDFWGPGVDAVTLFKEVNNDQDSEISTV